MDSRRGKPLTPEVKKLAVSVKQYFDQVKMVPYEPSVNRTADALGICGHCEADNGRLQS